MNLCRLGEGAGGGSEVGVEGGNAGRDLDRGQRVGGGDDYVGCLVPVVPGSQVSGQGVVHNRSGPPTGAESGFRRSGPQRGLSSAVGLLGGVRLSVELGMAGAEGGECSGKFIQVVRDGDGGKRGGLLGRQDHGLLSLVCCACGPFGGHSQPFGVLFGAFGRLLCLTVCGHGIGDLGVEGR